MFQNSAIKQNIQSSYVIVFCYEAESSSLICYKAMLLSRIFEVEVLQSVAILQTVQRSYVTSLQMDKTLRVISCKVLLSSRKHRVYILRNSTRG